MHVGGVVAADAPDPAVEQRAGVRALGFGVAGLVPQRHLEELRGLDVSTGESGDGVEQATVARNYTLWRNPDDRDDPVNEADLDEARRAALEEDPPWPRPAWLVEAARRLRFPMLWEAVATHWRSGAADALDPARVLTDHVQSVLVNQYREAHALPDVVEEHWPVVVDERSVQSGHPVLVDGVERRGFVLDTDPFVLGLATVLDDGRVLTAVLPRDDLGLLTVAFDSSASLD